MEVGDQTYGITILDVSRKFVVLARVSLIDFPHFSQLAFYFFSLCLKVVGVWRENVFAVNLL